MVLLAAEGLDRAWRQRALKYLVLAVLAPLLWVAFDAIVTGHPLYSLTATAGLAQELERTHGFGAVLASVWSYSVRIDHLPVVLGAIAGVVISLALAPRRTLVPLGALAASYLAFLGEGAAGASLVDRYLMGAATLALLFCAVTVGGWTMLERGALLRRAWIAAAVVLVIYGAASAASTLSLSNLRTTLAEHNDFHEGLATALHDPVVSAAVRRCGVVSLPDNKLIPDARWILDSSASATSWRAARRARSPSTASRRSCGACTAAASRCTRSAARCSWRRSWTSATAPSTRCRWRASSACTRAATTRCMPTAERRSRLLIWAGLAVVLAGGLALRLWGSGEGLPYIYNIDEATHFVPHAVRMFEQGTLNPHYFENPPAFTYLLHFVFAIAYGGGGGVVHHYKFHPAQLYELARIVSALLGTLALWLAYLTGARLFGRLAGLLAAAIEAVAFLPVVYGHLALNDVPTLAPLTASLLGSAGILRKGRARDYALAGAGLGLACATKYTAGIALAPLLAAAAVRFRDSEERARARALGGGLLLAGALALLAFVIANPYSVLDYSSFHAELVRQSTLSAEGQGKLGAPQEPAIVYYLWSLTWGLGWVPALAALGGALLVWRRDARAGAMLVPAPLLFLAFMGAPGALLRPLADADVPDRVPLGGVLRGGGDRARDAASRGALALAAGAAGLAGASSGGARGRAAAGAGASLQRARGARARARGHASDLRAWMLAHVPRTSAIVFEPVALEEWDRETLSGRPVGGGPRVWQKYPSLVVRVSPAGALEPGPTGQVGIETYETTLAPALLGYYTAHGYCWVISASTESGRAFADPKSVPHAIAYYRALEREGEVRYQRLALRRRRGPGGVQLRLELRLLPARLRAAGAADDGLPPARRPLREPLPAPWGYPRWQMQSCTDTDKLCLARAIELARNGIGAVKPNPVVGAVIARDGEVLGEGWHREYGGAHAEVNAIEACGLADLAERDAVRLARAVLPRGQDAAVHRRDPAGRASDAWWSPPMTRPRRPPAAGLGILRDEGVEVVLADGELAASARLLNQAFRKHARVGRPWVLFKSAMTLDGKVATRSGDSKWISSARTAARWRIAGAPRWMRSSSASARRSQTTRS